MTTINDVIKHSREREYMSGIERDNARIKATSEVFTPTPLVNQLLQTYIESSSLPDNFLDPSCGDGQILSEILISKMEHGMSFEQALSTIYGVDLMEDNINLCRERLLCGREDLRYIVEQNIVCADALRYHYRFDGSHPYDDEVKALEKKKRWSMLFEPTNS